MNFLIVSGTSVSKSLDVSLWMLTVSNALHMSSATTTDLCAGWFLFKPLAMV